MKGCIVPYSARRQSQLLAGPYTRLLAEHEQAIADLYGLFAGVFPKAESFWRSLAKQELGHRHALLGIEEKRANGQWAFKRPAFTTAMVAESLERLTDKMEAVRQQGISMRDALRFAADLERALAERSYFDILDRDTAEMMEVLRSLAGESERHANRVELEARRLKWRILGRSRAWPVPSEKKPTYSELQASVKAAQANMLGLLISLQEANAALYTTFSQRLKDRAGLWSELAAEELQHAAVLRGLYRILERGCLFHNVERFNRAAIHADMEVVLKCEFKAEHGLLTPRSAINTALRIERSPCVNGFYAMVASDAPEFRYLAESMNRHIADHIRKLETEARQLADPARASGDPWHAEPRQILAGKLKGKDA